MSVIDQRKKGWGTVFHLHKSAYDGIDSNHPDDPGIRGEFKGLDSSPVQNSKHGPEKDQVKQAHKSEKQRHVHSTLILDPDFEQHCVAAIEHGRHQRQEIAKEGSDGRLWWIDMHSRVRKVVATLSTIRFTDERDTQDTGTNSKELEGAKRLCLENRSNSQCEESGHGRQNG